MLAAAQCGKPVVEYAPLSIKSAVVGYGLAAKEQVQFMVTRLLRLDKSPDSADAADALAIAICHLHTAQSETQIKIQSRVQTKIQTVLKGRGATPSQSLKA
jgi:crossover junction endodeoxyribonuclease RuvC